MKNVRNPNYSLTMVNNPASKLTQFTFLLAFSAIVYLFLTACAHTPKSCQELDWYELGRQDGAKGLENNERQTVKVVCTESDESLAEALYNNGFDAGASLFCTRANGYQLGLRNTPVQDICPPFSKEEFKTGYEQGKRFTELNQLRSKLSQQIQFLEARLENLKDSPERTPTSEDPNSKSKDLLISLLNEKSKLAKEVATIEKEIQSIQQ